MGLIPLELRDGMEDGWTKWLDAIRENAERKHHKGARR
jgi:hypothetical protein